MTDIVTRLLNADPEADFNETLRLLEDAADEIQRHRRIDHVMEILLTEEIEFHDESSIKVSATRDWGVQIDIIASVAVGLRLEVREAAALAAALTASIDAINGAAS
jgi:hypothetical protein